MQHDIDDEKRNTCANADKPDMTYWVKKCTALFREQKIAAIENSSGECHGVSDTKTRMQDKVGAHNKRRTKQGECESTPEASR